MSRAWGKKKYIRYFVSDVSGNNKIKIRYKDDIYTDIMKYVKRTDGDGSDSESSSIASLICRI